MSGTVVSAKNAVQSQTQYLLSGKWQCNDTQDNAGVEREAGGNALSSWLSLDSGKESGG